MSKEEDVVKDYLEIREDYAPDRSIFTEEPDKLRRVKEIIARLGFLQSVGLLEPLHGLLGLGAEAAVGTALEEAAVDQRLL